MNFPVSSCYVVQNTASHNYYNQSGANMQIVLNIVLKRQTISIMFRVIIETDCNAVHYLLLAQRLA